ncbi:MAG: 30S ribosomal protein S20 [Clostridia bacterium]|nr:30S ribosomal protein S20 [Clostridia bacterium]
MANIKSQKKRILVSAKENKKNTSIRTRVKNAIKKFNAAIDAGDLELAEKLYPETVSVINKAKSEGVYHINAASRRIHTISVSLDALRATKA